MASANAPAAIHIGSDELPFVDIGGGSQLKVLQVKRGEGLGPVWGYTFSGAWKYKEYEYVNRAGSFLYEPAGSVHTLQCIEDQTRVFFHMHGANLNLDADGKVDSVVDGQTALEFYLAACEARGLPRPRVLIE
jgi:hypothetical protein